MKNLDVAFVFFIAFILSLFVFITLAIIQDKKEFDSYIGKELVMDCDTLLIVDTQYFGDYYFLSNGMKVSDEYVESRIILNPCK